MEPPRIEIIRGGPTPEEEEAVTGAILKIWREDIADAARGGGESDWVRSGRAAGARARLHELSSNAWMLSIRSDARPVDARRAGRGDAK